MEQNHWEKSPVQIFQKLAGGTSGWIAGIWLLVTPASGQDRILPELPQASTPVTLEAATDPVTGKSEFRYRGNNTPAVIRVQPGSTLNVEYKNELAAQSREDCFGHPCMQMTNLHFHGLHVSPNAPQDDSLDMIASPGTDIALLGADPTTTTSRPVLVSHPFTRREPHSGP